MNRRIEAAVALLRLSLRNLPNEAHFTVVLFASKHAYLSATPGLVEASRANVSKAIKELDQLIVGVGAADAAPGSAASEQQTRLGALLERLVSLGGGRYRAIPTPPAERAHDAQSLPLRER